MGTLIIKDTTWATEPKHIPCKKKTEHKTEHENKDVITNGRIITRSTDHWLRRSVNDQKPFVCTGCFTHFYFPENEIKKYQYCPTCGAKKVDTEDWVKKLRNTVENWPDWKKREAERLNSIGVGENSYYAQKECFDF